LFLADKVKMFLVVVVSAAFFLGIKWLLSFWTKDRGNHDAAIDH